MDLKVAILVDGSFFLSRLEFFRRKYSGNFPSNAIQNEVMEWVAQNQTELFAEWYVWHKK